MLEQKSEADCFHSLLVYYFSCKTFLWHLPTNWHGYQKLADGWLQHVMWPVACSAPPSLPMCERLDNKLHKPGTSNSVHMSHHTCKYLPMCLHSFSLFCCSPVKQVYIFSLSSAAETQQCRLNSFWHTFSLRLFSLLFLVCSLLSVHSPRSLGS